MASLREMGLGGEASVSLAQARDLASKWRAELIPWTFARRHLERAQQAARSERLPQNSTQTNQEAGRTRKCARSG